LFVYIYIVVVVCLYLYCCCCLFISILLLEIQLSRGEGWDFINHFNQLDFCACPKPGPGFQTPYDVVQFLCSMVWGVR